MDDNQLMRYSRQILLPQFGTEGQQILADSAVMVIGLGALGSPLIMYLAAAGVGHLILSDDDCVELSNLQRQIAYDTADIGRAKVNSAADRIQALNPEVKISKRYKRIDAQSITDDIGRVDAIVDACDNFTTRFVINAASRANRKPLISGAAIRFEGQVSVFNYKDTSPCYRCLYREEGEQEQTCVENGILSPLAGIIGSMQASETIKVLTGIGEPLDGRVLIMDSLTMELRTLKLAKDPLCPVCGAAPA